jgi:hypothetical protein
MSDGYSFHGGIHAHNVAIGNGANAGDRPAPPPLDVIREAVLELCRAAGEDRSRSHAYDLSVLRTAAAGTAPDTVRMEDAVDRIADAGDGSQRMATAIGELRAALGQLRAERHTGS